MKRIFSGPAWSLLAILFVALVFTACKKERDEKQEHHDQHSEDISDLAMNSDEEFRKNHQRLHWQTIWELLAVRWATAKYRVFENAQKDGYEPINVIVQNMGHHFMRHAIVDEKFELTKPEILVYRKNMDSSYTLVAVEYAVPIDKSPNKAPRGFFGNNDVWDRNTGFGLWLLHAWVWYKNPEGVFNPTNPRVHTH